MRTLEEIVKITCLTKLTDDELISLHEHIAHDHVGDDWDCIYYFDQDVTQYRPLSYEVSDVMDEYNYRFDSFI